MRFAGWNRLLAAGVVIALVAGCGGDDETADTNAPATTDTEAPATTAPAPATTAPAPETTVDDDDQTTTDAPVDTDAPATTAPVGDVDAMAWPTDYDPNGTLTLGIQSPPIGLDPDLQNVGSTTYLGPVFDRLTRITDEFEVEPMLATDWTFAPDGTYLEMTLREGVAFHDGTPFDAEVVKANIERSKTLQGSRTAAQLTSVDTVEVIDSHTVRFNFVEGGADLPAVLAEFAGAMINPAAFERADLNTAPFDGAGTGPYLLVDYTPNVRATYVPAQAPGEHWDVGAGLVSELTIMPVDVASQRINAVRSGDIDLGLVNGPEVAQGIELAESDEFDSREAVLATVPLMFLMRANRPPLDNIKVREAVRYAVDREALASLYSGSCDIATQFYPKGHSAYNPDLEGSYDHDPERARQLLAESGVDNPSFEVVHMPNYALFAQAVQAQLGDVGISVELRPLPVADYVAQWPIGDLPAAASVMAGSVHPSTVITANLLAGYNMILDEERAPFEELAAQGVDPSLSPEEQTAAYQEFFALLDGQSYFHPVCHTTTLWLERTGTVGALDRLMNTFIAVEPRFLYRLG